ncbi:MAG: coproporphyrinogen III oxidase family protein, partial [Eggerthellaceae bacterium]|nr:coproporphyrinogen III oxidase family protein [Eggerthellaceae bacterium]
EEGTPLAKAIRRGRFPQIDEDDEARHMELAERVLGEAGFVRYEVANYALPGYESRHNSAYWSGVPYLGLGRSAVTMTQNAERRMRKQDGYVTDDLNPKEMLAEDLMLAMRMSRGVSTTRVADAERRLPGAQACFEELCRLGLVRVQDEAFVPTERGWLCGNELYGRIFDLA